MRVLLLILVLTSTLSAAEVPPTPKPAPLPAKSTDATTTLDPATAKQAEAAADAYLKQLNTRPDPLAETALADIEVLLLEVHAFIDSGKPLKAGERYLSAIEKRKTIADDQRLILGKRLHKADLDLVTLSRQLLGQPAFDLGDPPAEKPTTDRPAADPVEQPAK